MAIINKQSKHAYSIKALLSYLILVALTLLSVVLGHSFTEIPMFIGAVLFIVVLKGQQITDIFMELQHAPPLWRFLLLGYVTLMPLILYFIYTW